MKTSLELKLLGKVRPKARPRFNKNTGAYTSKTYDAWKKAAIQQFKDQYYGGVPIQSANCEMIVCGEHHSDPDNTSGAVFDAMVQAGVLVDDKMCNLPKSSVEYKPDGQPLVYIKLTDIVYKKYQKNDSTHFELMEFPL